MRVSIPAHRREREWSCLAAFPDVLAYHDIQLTEDEVIRLCGATPIGISLRQGAEAAEALGLTAELQFDNELEWLWEPVALEDSVIIPLVLSPAGDRFSRHAVVLCGIEQDAVLVLDPAVGAAVEWPLPNFMHRGPRWTGRP